MDQPEATASAIIHFAEKLENETSALYKILAERYAERREKFLAFVEESRKSKELVIRTYRETITDALEACFSFKGLKLDEYKIKTIIPDKLTYSDAIQVAMELEEMARKFYADAAECGKSLLATIPRAFKKAADVRDKRRSELKSLLDNPK